MHISINQSKVDQRVTKYRFGKWYSLPMADQNILKGGGRRKSIYRKCTQRSIGLLHSKLIRNVAAQL